MLAIFAETEPNCFVITRVSMIPTKVFARRMRSRVIYYIVKSLPSLLCQPLT